MLLPAGSGNGDCDLAIAMFKRSFEELKVNHLGAATAAEYDVGEVKKDISALEWVRKLAGRIESISN